MAAFYESSWGGIRIWLSRIRTDAGRKLVVQEYTRGDVPDLSDHGDVPLVVSCTMLFDDMTGSDEDPEERLERLIDLKGKGEAQIFTHPMSIYGSYLAMISEFTHEIAGDGTITAEATFTAAEAVGTVAGDPVGISDAVTADALDARTAELLADLESSDIMTSEVPARAALASNVFDAALDARSVLVSISNVSEQIAQEIDDYELELDNALWPAFKSYVLVGEAARAAGALAMGDVPLMTLRIAAPVSLRRLVADIYPASEAEDRYAEARSLNDIPTPGRIATDTQLRLHQPDRAR